MYHNKVLTYLLQHYSHANQLAKHRYHILQSSWCLRTYLDHAGGFPGQVVAGVAAERQHKNQTLVPIV